MFLCGPLRPIHANLFRGVGRDSFPTSMARPRIALTDDHIRQIEVLAGYGLTQNAIAHCLGISHDTFTRRKADEERVLRALEKGRAVAESMVGQALFLRAKQGDVAAICWWEKTRCGRSEKQETKHEGSTTIRVIRE